MQRQRRIEVQRGRDLRALRRRVEVHSVQSACALAARGIGATLVNELMARDFAPLPIEIRPLKERLLHRFAFAVTDGVPPTEIARHFMETSIARFHSLLSDKPG